MMRLLLGIIVGASLMYLFDPRQGAERREAWGERVRQGKDQVQTAREQAAHAVESGRETFTTARDKVQNTVGTARSRAEGAVEEAATNGSGTSTSVADAQDA
jgi:gas vesicle protein